MRVATQKRRPKQSRFVDFEKNVKTLKNVGPTCVVSKNTITPVVNKHYTITESH